MLVRGLFAGVFVRFCFVVKLYRVSTAVETGSVLGHLQRLVTKSKSQPPVRPDLRILRRCKDFRRWDSVPRIHPEPVLKTDDAKLHCP